MSKPGELFIVDNSDSEWRVRSYLLEWCDLSRALDVATGYFEIGALLALQEKWQSVEKIRILMGDEVSLRTKHAFAKGLNGADQYFAETLGVHSLRRHFVELEKKILGQSTGQAATDLDVGPEILEAEDKLRSDLIFHELVVQRSRSYVKRSQQQQGKGQTLFPQRHAPQVVPYNLKSAYGRLLESVEKAFSKETPLFVLSIYYPLELWKGDKDSPDYKKWDENRQKQVVSLIRTLFLKRFESSAQAFEGSCWRLLQKVRAWVSVHAESDHDKARLERWKAKNHALIGYVKEHQREFWPADADEDQVEDFLNEDVLNQIEKLDPDQFDVGKILDGCMEDLNQLAEFLNLLAEIKPERDDKLKALIRLLKTDKVLKTEKVLIFTEFAETARYLQRELEAAGINGVHRIDGGSTQKQRSEVIRRFAPYYNGTTPQALTAENVEPIRILISTDVLSEGLNLQDATRIINYDLHWNPVRLMQRIGRVDRRMNPEIEARMIADDPAQKKLRGNVEFWNFLPPDELDELLRLFKRVAGKTLVISRTLGIEGRKLLTPDDAFDPVKELNEQFDGHLSDIEQLRLELDELTANHPELAAALPDLPLKLFAGKASPQSGTQAVFFCHRIPRPDSNLIDTESGKPRWSDAAGVTVWTCCDPAGKTIATEAGAIADLIRATPKTPRKCTMDKTALSELRAKVEHHLKHTHLKQMQAPVGVRPLLKCWMEIN